MKILFVMKHRGNAGSTHAVANYMRVAPKHGHSVSIYGDPIWYVPELQFSMDIRSFDRVVYVYESELYRIKRMQDAVLLDQFPRRHRLIVAIEHTDDHRLAQRRPRGSDLLIPVHDPERGGLTRVGKIDVTAGRVERGEGDSHRQGDGAAIRLGHVCSGSGVEAGPARAGVGPGGRKQVTCRKASPPGGLNALSHCDFHHHRGGGVVAPQRPDDRTTRTAPGPGN